MNSLPDVQVTSLLPEFIAPESEHVTSTTVPRFTGNCVVVFNMPAHSVFSPVQPDCNGAVTKMDRRPMTTFGDYGKLCQ